MKHFSVLSALTMACTLLPLSACTTIPSNIPSNTGISDPTMEDNNTMMKDDDNAMMKDDTQNEGMMKDAGAAMSNTDTMKKDEGTMNDSMMKNGTYIDASASALPASVLTDGSTKVLFFWAGWCPTCKAANTELTALYESNTDLLSTYKINYDTESQLKSRYGVTTQHTFVKVDGQGTILKVVVGPSNAALAAFLKA